MSWRRWAPYLDLWVDLGFLEIRTELWNRRYDGRTTTWVGLHVSVFAWVFAFRLYQKD